MAAGEADQWRQMAAECRARAAASATDAVRDALNKLADNYEAEATRLDESEEPGTAE